MHYSQTAPECQPDSKEYSPSPADVDQPVINLANLDPEAFQAALDSLPDPVISNSAPKRIIYSQSPFLQKLIEQQVARTDKIGSKPEAEKHTQTLSHKGLEAVSREHCPVADLSPLITVSKTLLKDLSKPKRSKTLQAHIDKTPNPFSKAWLNLWPHEKLAVSFEAASRANGLVFTLNLSKARETTLLSRADPADDLRRYVAREMRAAFSSVLPFSFIFEISPITGKLHAHGVVIPIDGRKSHRDALRLALARAGGKITGNGAARQTAFKPVTDGIGWAGYLSKAFDDACNHTGTHKITFISDDLTRLSRSLHAQMCRKSGG